MTSTVTPQRSRELVEKAVKLAGSQGKLAKLIGISQQGVDYLSSRAPRVTAEMAVRIEKATNGKIKRNQLRPDIFGGYVKKKSKKTARRSTASVAAAGEAEISNDLP